MDSSNSRVVKEIPIYISQNLSQNLMLYKFPLEGSLTPDIANVLECSLKEDREVIIDLERDIDSSNYSKSHGEQMAINADGTSNVDDPMFPRKLMDKNMLVSRLVPGRDLAIGLFQDDEIHLTPAAGMVLLRPSYKYLDRGDRRLKQENKDAGGDVSEEEEELQQVTVKFSRQETDRAKKAREKSFSYLSKQSAKQTWYKADYYEPSSSKAEIEQRKLFCSKTGEKVTESRPDTIVKVVVEDDDEDDIRGRTAHGLPLTNLQSVSSLLERIKIIMAEVRVLDMSTLNRLLGEPETPNEIQDRIKVVQHVAVLVQGCWVVQSDVIIPADSSPEGVPCPLLRCARDFMLYLFTKSRAVSRRKLMEIVKLSGETVKGLLEQVSILNINKEWEFKLDTDTYFIAAYPEVAQRQQAKWELRVEQLLAGLRPPEPGPAPTVRNRRRSGRDSFSSDTDTEAKRVFPNPKPRRSKLSESHS